VCDSGCGPGGVTMGIGCYWPRGDWGMGESPWEENPMWDALLDGAESCLWDVAFSSDC
jgi:hypothetical protein